MRTLLEILTENSGAFRTEYFILFGIAISEHLPDGTAEPSSYDALLASEEFLNLLYNRSNFLSRSIDKQKRTLESTEQVLATIEDELVRQSSN